MSDYRENDEYDTPRGGGGRHHQQVGRRRDNDDNEAQAPHGRFEGSYSGGHQQHGYQRRHENEYDAPETEAEEYGTGTQSRRHEGGGGGGRRHEYDQRYQDTASHSQYDANSAGRYQQQSQDQEHGGDNRYESESFQSRPQNPYPAAHQSRPSYHQQQQQQQYSASPYPEPSNDSSYGDAGDYDAESTGRPQNPYPAVKPQYHQQSQHSSAAPYPASGRYDSDVPSGLQNPYPPAHGQGHQQQGQHHGESHVQSHPAGTGAHKPSAYANLPVHESAPDNQKQYYSNMQGSRKALLIGINYTGTSAELKGCHNDANNLAQFIQRNFGYDRNNIRILLDDENARRDTLPTKQNILNAMAWLVKGASPGDALFFHYSGHGSQVESHAGDEIDSMAETICPLDYESAGQINDDEMHRLLVAPLPKGCRLTAIMDCCHSGSSLDLPFCYDTSGQIKGPDHLENIKDGAMSAFKAYTTKDLGGVFSSLALTGKKIFDGNKADELSKKTKASDADVISWSGCRDDQTSADASEAGRATGAMSHAFVQALTEAPDQTYLQLLNTVRDILKPRYSQKPQLSCSHELDCNLKAVF